MQSVRNSETFVKRRVDEGNDNEETEGNTKTRDKSCTDNTKNSHNPRYTKRLTPNTSHDRALKKNKCRTQVKSYYNTLNNYSMASGQQVLIP